MAGLVLDLYDDPEMRVLRQTYPQPEEMPDFIKEADVLAPELLDSLPDDHFALVLVGQDGMKMRKYAMVDAAHTALSAIYLLEARHLLTEEAMKTASARIVSACLQQGLEPPAQLLVDAQEKLADLYPSSSLRNLVAPPDNEKEPEKTYPDHFPDPELKAQATSLQERIDELDLRQDEIRLSKDELRNQAKRLEMDQVQRIRSTQGEKVASLWVGGTLRSLVSPDGSDSNALCPSTSSNRPYPDNFPDPDLKARAQQLQLQDDQLGMKMDELRLHQQQVEVEAKRLELTQVQHLQHAQQPPAQAPGVEPYVEDGTAPPQVTTKEAAVEDCLMVSEDGRGIYAVRNYGEAEKAASYFLEHQQAFTPDQRREYCTKLAARVRPWGLQLPDVIEKYASVEVDPCRQVYFDLRKQNCHDPEIRAQYDGLSKVASAADPEVLVIALAELDRQAGLDHYYDRGIPDPYFTLFGKTAGTFVNDEWSWTNDLGDTLTRDALNNLLQVETYRKKLKERFDDNFVNALSVDPINIFESLPDPTKTIVARIAAPS